MSNLIELAKLIFQDEPQAPYSIQMQFDDYKSIEDLFEVILHLFIYGMKIKDISITNINDIKPYFKAIGLNFNLTILEYSEYEFLTNPLYLKRYCNISNSTFNDTDLDNLQFILSRNYKSVDNLNEMNACYIHHIPNDFNQSFIAFINFDIKMID